MSSMLSNQFDKLQCGAAPDLDEELMKSVLATMFVAGADTVRACLIQPSPNLYQPAHLL